LATELGVEQAHPHPVAEITVVGEKLSDNPRIIEALVTKAKEHTQMLGMSMNTNSGILYVSAEKNLDGLFNDVHKIILTNPETKAMAVKKDLAFLKIRGVGLEETQGIIGKVADTLRVNSMNISGVLTITSSILLFVDWNEREKALELVRKSLRSHQK
jgi:aspartate kinase